MTRRRGCEVCGVLPTFNGRCVEHLTPATRMWLKSLIETELNKQERQS